MTSRKYRLNSRLVIASSVPLVLDNIYCSNSLLELSSQGSGWLALHLSLLLCRSAYTTLLYPSLMLIRLYSYKLLSDCISQIDQIGIKVEGLRKAEKNPSPPQLKLFDF